MQAWEEFLQAQEKKVGRVAVDKWLRPLKIVRFDAGNLYLEARDSFQALWFEEHIRHQAQQHLLTKNRRRIKVHLAVAKEEEESEGERPQPIERGRFELRFDELDPNSTFSHFVTTPANEVAYKLLGQLCGVCNNDQLQVGLSTFNPIFLHGPSGSGKSHLLMATARSLRDRGYQVIYVRAESFAEHVVAAIRLREMEQFRDQYRKCDVLLVDDIQVLARKGATQEEFFHTFNTLHVERKQVILSANSPPRELQSVEPRLVSRFEWGIVLPLEPLSQASLAELLQRRSLALRFPLRPEVFNWLLATFVQPANLIRALEALLLRTHLESTTGQQITLLQAQSYLADLSAEEKRQVVTPQRIVEVVADDYGIESSDLLGKSQTREVSMPRKVAMYLCRTQLSLPLKKIGEIFSRDHSTVIASVRAVKSVLGKSDDETAAIVSRISKKL
jgi:chromosomal replication initiator protein